MCECECVCARAWDCTLAEVCACPQLVAKKRGKKGKKSHASEPLHVPAWADRYLLPSAGGSRSRIYSFHCRIGGMKVAEGDGRAGRYESSGQIIGFLLGQEG